MHASIKRWRCRPWALRARGMRSGLGGFFLRLRMLRINVQSTSAIHAGAPPARALPHVALGEWLKRQGKWLIILPPLLFLLVFFLIPFAFALTISFADTAVRVPPFTDILSVSPDWHIHLSLNLGNFQYLFTDEVYGLSYLYSLKTAFFS